MKTGTEPRRVYNVGVIVPFVVAAEDAQAAGMVACAAVEAALEAGALPREHVLGDVMAWGEALPSYVEDRNAEDRITLEEVTATFSVPASEAPIAPMEGYE